MVSNYCQRHNYYGSLTTVDKNNLTGILAGDTVFDSTLGRLEYWTGAAWTPFWTGAPAGTYTGLSDTPGAHTAGAVPFTNAAGNALAADASFTYNDGTNTLDVDNIHTGDIILKNGWRIVEDWDEGGEEDRVPGGGVVIKNNRGKPILTVTNDDLIFKGRKIA